MKKDYQFIDLGLKIKDTLIIADLHLGYEEALSKEGVFLPKFHMKDLLFRLRKIIDKAKPKTIIINGDLKHEFGSISSQEWKDTFRLVDFLTKKSELKIIKGNHDLNTSILLRRTKTKIFEDIIIDNFFMTHGDKIKEIPKECDTVIIGHEHPTISLREGGRIERMKCFLVGEYKKKKVIVLPSMNLVTAGHDLIKERPISPYIKTAENFDVYAVNDEILFFGKLKLLKEL